MSYEDLWCQMMRCLCSEHGHLGGRCRDSAHPGASRRCCGSCSSWIQGNQRPWLWWIFSAEVCRTWCCALMILMCDIPVFNWEKSVWQRQSDDFQTSSAGAIPCFLPRKMCKTCRTWWCLTWMEPLNCTLEMKQGKLGLLVLWSRLSLDVWHGNLTMSPVSWLLMWSQNPESDLCQDWHIPA